MARATKKAEEPAANPLAPLPIQFIKVEIPEVETIDIGEYCTECRRHVGEETKWFAARQPHVHENEDGSRVVGFRCEPCQPLDGTLMEPIAQALVERRFDEAQVRDHMRRVGQEDIFEYVVAPMLDTLETLLQLERK